MVKKKKEKIKQPDIKEMSLEDMIDYLGEGWYNAIDLEYDKVVNEVRGQVERKMKIEKTGKDPHS